MGGGLELHREVAGIGSQRGGGADCLSRLAPMGKLEAGKSTGPHGLGMELRPPPLPTPVLANGTEPCTPWADRPGTCFKLLCRVWQWEGRSRLDPTANRLVEVEAEVRRSLAVPQAWCQIYFQEENGTPIVLPPGNSCDCAKVCTHAVGWYVFAQHLNGFKINFSEAILK